jgi:hypothetical protein
LVQIEKVFLPHRRPGSFSSEKEALHPCPQTARF